MIVIADKHMFETVIGNLISNAIKFSNAGGKVNVSAGYNKDNTVEIKISDSGIGMSPQNERQVFLMNEKTSRNGD